jgi:hypothetical protein
MFKWLDNIWNYTLKGYRTIIATVILGAPYVWEGLMVLVGGFVDFAPTYKLSTYVPPEYMWAWNIAMVAANIFLRFKTTTPVGKKT